MSPGEEEEIHLAAHDIAAYLDRGLPEGEARRVQEHLAECAFCRAEVTELTGLVRERSGRRRWTLVVPAAAAAVALLLFATPWSGPPDAPSGARERSPGAAEREGVPPLSIVAPAPGAFVGAKERRFVWRSAGPDATYRMVLARADGEILWETMTSDTVAAAPPEIETRAGNSYLWYVDALLADGRTATTGVQRFVVTP